VVDPEGAKAAFQPPADENERPTTPPEIAKCVPLDRRVSSGEKHARLTDRPDERRATVSLTDDVQPKKKKHE
jgi:hypothetical protein